jgi:hypothetical protein
MTTEASDFLRDAQVLFDKFTTKRLNEVITADPGRVHLESAPAAEVLLLYAKKAEQAVQEPDVYFFDDHEPAEWRAEAVKQLADRKDAAAFHAAQRQDLRARDHKMARTIVVLTVDRWPLFVFATEGFDEDAAREDSRELIGKVAVPTLKQLGTLLPEPFDLEWTPDKAFTKRPALGKGKTPWFVTFTSVEQAKVRQVDGRSLPLYDIRAVLDAANKQKPKARAAAPVETVEVVAEGAVEPPAPAAIEEPERKLPPAGEEAAAAPAAPAEPQLVEVSGALERAKLAPAAAALASHRSLVLDALATPGRVVRSPQAPTNDHVALPESVKANLQAAGLRPGQDISVSNGDASAVSPDPFRSEITPGNFEHVVLDPLAAKRWIDGLDDVADLRQYSFGDDGPESSSNLVMVTDEVTLAAKSVPYLVQFIQARMKERSASFTPETFQQGMAQLLFGPDTAVNGARDRLRTALHNLVIASRLHKEVNRRLLAPVPQ